MQFRNHLRIKLILPVFVFASLAFPSQSNAAGFQGLGDLPGGRFYSEPLGISADGTCVVGCSSSASSGDWNYEAFRWTQPTGMIGLGYLPGLDFTSRALDVSGDGSVVVGSSYGTSNAEAFRWTEPAGMSPLGSLPGGNSSGEACGISKDGLVIVGYSMNVDNEGEAFRWTQAQGMVGLGDLEGGNWGSIAQAVSGDGSTVVGSGTSPSGLEAFRWTQSEGMLGLGELEGGIFKSIAQAVSSDGSTVVGHSYSASPDNALGRSEAFRWTQSEGMVGLGFLPGGWASAAWDVSGDGSVVVGRSAYAADPSRSHAFLWTESGGMTSIEELLTNDYALDLEGWVLYEATGISDDGFTIVGWGYNPEGANEAWIARISPSPVEIQVAMNPRTLNLRSKGKWIACRIWLPEDYDVADVNSYSVFLEDQIPAEWTWFDEDEQVIMAKFRRPALQELLADLDTPTTVELLISGQLNDATPFEGTDTIKLIDKTPRKNPARRAILRRKL